MKVRRGDRRYQESIWRRLLGWLLRERRDGWEQRARPTVEGSDKADRRHNQALSYDAVVDRRKECGELERAPAAPVERERHMDGGME